MDRRHILSASAATLGLATIAPVRVALAAITPTPPQDRGPFYPRTFPSDRDNDLTTVAGATGTAHGEVTAVSGRILDVEERPLEGVRIEIWQVNGFGRYHHEGDDQDKPLDPNFQGYGTFTTGADGAYTFRTVKPVAYPGRAPHIHFAVSKPKAGHW